MHLVRAGFGDTPEEPIPYEKPKRSGLGPTKLTFNRVPPYQTTRMPYLMTLSSDLTKILMRYQLNEFQAI